MVREEKAIQSAYNIEKISNLLSSIHIQTERHDLYILACIHRSIVNERPSYAPEHNERLEFLGDAVLELVITKLLYDAFPEKNEGELTDIRSALVRGRNLAKIAKTLEVGPYIFLGKGEEKGGGRENDYLLANTIEAIIGALYIDKGYDLAYRFIDTYIYQNSIEDILEQKLFKDYKTLFQESVQAKFDITPHYSVLEDSGPDHDKVYIVGVYVGDTLYGKGQGSSKKKAQEKAAQNAYANL